MRSNIKILINKGYIFNFVKKNKINLTAAIECKFYKRTKNKNEVMVRYTGVKFEKLR